VVLSLLFAINNNNYSIIACPHQWSHNNIVSYGFLWIRINTQLYLVEILLQRAVCAVGQYCTPLVFHLQTLYAITVQYE